MRVGGGGEVSFRKIAGDKQPGAILFDGTLAVCATKRYVTKVT